MVSDLIIGVVVDVVGHVFLKNLQGVRVGFIASAARNFVVLDAAEFVVLDPKVGLEYFCRRCESEQGCVSAVLDHPGGFCRSDAWPTVLHRWFPLQRRVICPGKNGD